MKGLLDFEKSMKNARARYFLKSKSKPSFLSPPSLLLKLSIITNYAIDVWVAVVIKWLEVAEDLRKGKPWHELSSPFYAWLACNAVPYHDSPEATSGCKRFAKVRYEDFAKCVLSVTGRKRKKAKTFNFKESDFTYPDGSSCPSTDIED